MKKKLARFGLAAAGLTMALPLAGPAQPAGATQACATVWVLGDPHKVLSCTSCPISGPIGVSPVLVVDLCVNP